MYIGSDIPNIPTYKIKNKPTVSIGDLGFNIIIINNIIYSPFRSLLFIIKTLVIGKISSSNNLIFPITFFKNLIPLIPLKIIFINPKTP